MSVIEEVIFNITGQKGITGDTDFIKDLGLKEPYVGKIPLVNGEIAEDLTNYFTVSEQQPGSVALGVRMNELGMVDAAGGMIIQVLPNADDSCISALEDMLLYMDSLSLLVQDAQKIGGPSIVRNLFALIFKDLPEEYMPQILDERNVRFHCDCSRERMEAALVSIGRRDLRQLIDEDGQAELTCNFCGTRYSFNKEELEAIWKRAQ